MTNTTEFERAFPFRSLLAAAVAAPAYLDEVSSTFSHLALVNAYWAIAQLKRQGRSVGPIATRARWEASGFTLRGEARAISLLVASKSGVTLRRAWFDRSSVMGPFSLPSGFLTPAAPWRARQLGCNLAMTCADDEAISSAARLLVGEMPAIAVELTAFLVAGAVEGASVAGRWNGLASWMYSHAGRSINNHHASRIFAAADHILQAGRRIPHAAQVARMG